MVDRTGRSATEIRREKEASAKGPVLPPKRTFDDILRMLGDLDAGAKVYQDRLVEIERAKKAGRPLPPSDAGYYDRPDPPRALPKVIKSPTPPSPEPAPRPAPRPPAAASAPPRPPPTGAAGHGAAPRPAQPAAAPRPPMPRPPPPAGRPVAARPPDDDEDMDLPPSPPAKADAPVNRSPRAAMAGASGPNLDDLFGGGPQEGRVKIGKRTRPKAQAGEPGTGEGETEG
jgi:hypothetical protein